VSLNVDSAPKNVKEGSICLNMIVKNEVDNVEALIPSLEGHISAYYVCDTGSTDGTVKKMKQLFDKILVKGLFARHKWKNFAHNRNLCLEDGERKLKNTCEYWLILDADQVLMSTEKKSLLDLDLDKDAYWLIEQSYGVSFSNMKILKASHPWFYVGAIHETIKTNVEPTVGTLPDSIYTTHNTKHERGIENDIKMMQESLKEEPDDARMIFHLAKALHAFNMTASIQYYMKRIELGETPGLEEVFWSKYAIARIIEVAYTSEVKDSELMKSLRDAGVIQGDAVDFDDVKRGYEIAALDRPYRYEPWLELATIYWNEKDDLSECYKFAKIGINAGPNTHLTYFAKETTIYSLHHLVCWCGSMLHESLNETKGSCEKIVQDLSRVTSPTQLEIALVKDAKEMLADYSKSL
jgi:glycosyltransferase involved in cell wall biosynthesis